ncbi:septation protein SepH [Amycolatopsis sp. QT-25]|uniref:septation protein SepH n=1 Tax=Amycolatopsis sp. QT-25 TaxID=3034022 RepID=UPI0023ED627C|nr:septation protein SepH [Amycolatopsis sp. QT-25]WET78827.1 septation protein SepH [Amycolatopsis sp. QT-25]
MRALRVVGLHEDGKSIVCEDPASRTRFLLPADERLRAAARGDITRLGQIEIESESQMRPREIQARIRAGESVEQVASSAGVTVQRVERFAYPVLLERSRTAELAQRAHPVREDGPDVQTLGEVVAHSFGQRGHDYSQATWDSWRGDDGKWVVVLSWKAGRSDNRAHWSFSPGAHGGTVQALDENAEVLLNPNAYRAPRTVRALDPGREAVVQPTLDSAPDEPVAKVIDAPITEPEEDVEPPLPADEPEEVAESAPRAKGKRSHPIVPSWEDVLLGVRSQRG